VRPEDRLSLPDLVGEVCRAQWVTAKGLDRRGKPITVEGEGLLARALQHEVDHLNGTLFVARVEDPTLIWKVSELKAATQKKVIHNLVLQRYFPRCLRWIVRSNAQSPTESA
jgi:peptide deformylase